MDSKTRVMSERSEKTQITILATFDNHGSGLNPSQVYDLIEHIIEKHAERNISATQIQYICNAVTNTYGTLE